MFRTVDAARAYLELQGLDEFADRLIPLLRNCFTLASADNDRAKFHSDANDLSANPSMFPRGFEILRGAAHFVALQGDAKAPRTVAGWAKLS
jgi:hypothetical protein